MITFSHKGNFDRTLGLLDNYKKRKYLSILERYAYRGVDILSSNTPKDSGVTADSWGVKISTTKNGFSISWTNSNIVDGVPVVILIQYGHATKSGGFVEGVDFINHSMKPLFDQMVDSLWKEVTTL